MSAAMALEQYGRHCSTCPDYSELTSGGWIGVGRNACHCGLSTAIQAEREMAKDAEPTLKASDVAAAIAAAVHDWGGMQSSVQFLVQKLAERLPPEARAEFIKSGGGGT